MLYAIKNFAVLSSQYLVPVIPDGGIFFELINEVLVKRDKLLLFKLIFNLSAF